MPLQRGEVQGYDFDRMIVEFRLREVIEERASRKFLEEQVQADRPVV